MGIVQSSVLIVLEGVTLSPIETVGRAKRYRIKEATYPLQVTDFRIAINSLTNSITDNGKFIRVFCSVPADIDISYKSVALSQIELKSATEDYQKGDKLFILCVAEKDLPRDATMLCQKKLADGRIFYIGIK